MSEQELHEEILQDLTAELGALSNEDAARLSSKIKNAIREVRMKRSYPAHFTEDKICDDLQGHYSNIRELALYDYNQVGVEGQVSHNENGTNRSWKNRNDCLIGVYAFCG